jgi:hypothetical protein
MTMPTIGDRAVNLHTTDRDETIYAEAGHTLSHVSNVALRRTLPTKLEAPLRTQMRFGRGFAVGDVEKLVTVSIAVTVAPGVDSAGVSAYVADTLTQAAATAGSLSVTGDIHLS